MEVRICKNCRKMFRYLYGPELCPDCSKSAAEDNNDPVNRMLNATLMPMTTDEEAKFEQVKEYIMKNPRATVAQIASDNDITPSKLFGWIRDDRLEFSDDSSYAWFTCEKCGAKIRSGRFCNRCKAR